MSQTNNLCLIRRLLTVHIAARVTRDSDSDSRDDLSNRDLISAATELVFLADALHAFKERKNQPRFLPARTFHSISTSKYDRRRI